MAGRSPRDEPGAAGGERAPDAGRPPGAGAARLHDRAEGGRRLVPLLERYRRAPRTVVLGLPRGGVVPAAEIAAALGLPLDVLVARKIGAPDEPELAIGAVAEGGEPWVDERLASLTGADAAYVARAAARERTAIAERRRRFRGGAALALPARATVILVDDGVATGATVVAAVRALRSHPAVARVVLAVPVAPPATVERLRPLVDELVAVATPAAFGAVGRHYDTFAQVDDDEVATILARARAGTRGEPPPAGGAAPCH